MLSRRMIVGFSGVREHGCRAWRGGWAAGTAARSGCCSPTPAPAGPGAGRRGRRRGGGYERASSPSELRPRRARRQAGDARRRSPPRPGGRRRCSRCSGATPLARVAEALPGGRSPSGDAERRRSRSAAGSSACAAAAAPAEPVEPVRRAARRARARVVELEDARLRRRHRGDGLRAGLPGAGRRGDRRRRGRATGSTPTLARELVVETAAATAELLRTRHRGRRARRRRLARAAAPRPACAALDREGAAAGLRGGRAGLAGEDAGQMPELLALTRNDVADYVSALFIVYIILIFARILSRSSRGSPTRDSARGARLRHRDDRPLSELLPPLPPADRRRGLRPRPEPDDRDHRAARRCRRSSSA